MSNKKSLASEWSLQNAGIRRMRRSFADREVLSGFEADRVAIIFRTRLDRQEEERVL